MKRFIPLLIAILGLHLTAFAQNEEYYKKDTLPQQKRQSTIIIPNEAEQEKAEARPVEGRPRYEGSQPILDRLRLGGSFGLSLGNYTNINLSPMAGLNLTDKLVAGAGLTYMYASYRPRGASASLRSSTSNYGGRIFLMYSLLPMITLQAEYEGLNVQHSSIGQDRTRTWIGSPLVGGAYTQPLGGRFTRSIHFTALYNLSYNSQISPTTGLNISPYSSPFVFRITFL
ncbi:hypothetical protein [Persicitalea sp.]|uniref:hypothetical protein n=1 Tax=Persicitalea sp. TaxID=3100273 RepID=UPI003593024D